MDLLQEKLINFWKKLNPPFEPVTADVFVSHALSYRAYWDLVCEQSVHDILLLAESVVDEKQMVDVKAVKVWFDDMDAAQHKLFWRYVAFFKECLLKITQ